MKKFRQKLDQNQPDQQRREFVKTSALAGACLAAGVALPGAAAASVDVEEAEQNKQKGYQLTQHVIDYYKAAAT